MFETKPDPQLETLKTQLAELITINKALLKKLEQQDVKLTALARFVSNETGPAFGVV